MCFLSGLFVQTLGHYTIQEYLFLGKIHLYSLFLHILSGYKQLSRRSDLLLAFQLSHMHRMCRSNQTPLYMVLY